jgi:hypothetical protein
MTRRAQEKEQIEQMLREIAATPTGAPAVAYARSRHWRIRFGKPAAGAFTYPWKRISLRRGYSYRQTRAMLAHELGHVWKYPRALADSLDQECEAEAFAQSILGELGQITEREREAWFAAPREVHHERIRGYSRWHARTLPAEQPGGWRAAWFGMRQAIGLVADWIGSGLGRVCHGRAGARRSGGVG